MIVAQLFKPFKNWHNLPHKKGFFLVKVPAASFWPLGGKTFEIAIQVSINCYQHCISTIFKPKLPIYFLALNVYLLNVCYLKNHTQVFVYILGQLLADMVGRGGVRRGSRGRS